MGETYRQTADRVLGMLQRADGNDPSRGHLTMNNWEWPTGVALYGVTVHVTDKRELEPVRLGVTMLRTLETMYPDDFEYSAPKNPANRWHIDLAAGGTELRLSGLPAEELCRKWQAEADRFAAEKAKYYLYRH